MKAKILFVFFLFQSGTAFGNVAGSDSFGAYSETQDGKTAASEKLVLFEWLKKRAAEREKARKEKVRRNNLLSCLEDCNDGDCIKGARGFLIQHDPECEDKCRVAHANKRPPGLSLKTASIKNQNPFKALEEVSQKSYENKAPLYLADDESECLDNCICHGGSTEGCVVLCG